MPSKHTIKSYVPGGYYHVFNRGVENRSIFTDDEDYRKFISYLSEALLPPPDRKALRRQITVNGTTFMGAPKMPKNFSETIRVVAFCLMPHSFHLLLQQSDERSVEIFTRSLMTRYAMYFNKKIKRVGPLFAGPYKAASITTDQDLIHLTRYIHRIPATITDKLDRAYSSYSAYLRHQKVPWVACDPILAYFEKKSNLPFMPAKNTYQEFVEKEFPDDAARFAKFAME